MKQLLVKLKQIEQLNTKQDKQTGNNDMKLTNQQIIDLAPSIDELMDVRDAGESLLGRYLLGQAAEIRQLHMDILELEEIVEELYVDKLRAMTDEHLGDNLTIEMASNEDIQRLDIGITNEHGIGMDGTTG